MAQAIIEKLLVGIGGKFSRELGIDLSGADPAKIFRWILAARLLQDFRRVRDVGGNLYGGETKW